MYAIMCTGGEMSWKEVRDECAQQRWVPLLVYRPAGRLDGPPLVPLFYSPDTAQRFFRRNARPDWVQALVELNKDSLERMCQKGWLLNPMHFPRKMDGLDGVVFDIEVFELTKQPGVYLYDGIF